MSRRGLTPEAVLALRVSHLALKEVIKDIQHRHGFGTYRHVPKDVESMFEGSADLVVRGEISSIEGGYKAFFESEVTFDEESGSYEEVVYVSLFEANNSNDAFRYKILVPQPGVHREVSTGSIFRSRMSEISQMKPMKGYKEIPPLEEALKEYQEREDS